MTWANITCSEEGCDETVTVGHYGIGDYEDEYADYEIIVTCGECNREKEGIPSRYEEELEKASKPTFSDFKNRVKNEGIDNVINYDVVNRLSFKEMIELSIELWKETKLDEYLQSVWALLGCVPNNGIKVVVE